MDMTSAGGSGTNVIQYQYYESSTQKWKIIYEGNGLYSLAPSHDLNLRLDVPNATSANGENLWVYTSNNTPAQRWRIIPNGNGTYRLMPYCSKDDGRVLDIEGPSTSNNAPLQTWTWDGTSKQMMWYLDEVNTTKNYGTVRARGEVAAGDNLKYIFKVNSTAEYVIETARPNGENGALCDTVISLLHTNGQLIASDDDSGEGNYSRIVVTLSPGIYMVELAESGGNKLGLYTYIAVFKSNELAVYSSTGNISDYAQLCYDFIKIGDSSSKYNCFAYALGYTDRWIDPKGSLSKTTAYMESQGYTKVNAPTDNCVVAYGTTDAVGHFARIENGVVKAKLGPYELMQHSSQRAYFAQSTYGPPIAYYIKNN